VLALTTGGQLAQKAVDYGVPLWRFAHVGQPRAAVGYSFGLLLAALHRLGIVPDPSVELTDAVFEMRTQQASFLAETPVVQNLAKQMAGRLIERWPTVLGAGLLAPVARRWRTQISEIAKAVGQYEELPEADHNMLAGTQYPEALIRRSIMVLLRASREHPRHALRTDLTREILKDKGFDTDVIEGQGNTRLAQQWTCLHCGDYVAFYLAMAYGVDPTPVHSIEAFKVRMKAVL
jgi:glucose/mannose-6-phosphate isomerase